jgi:hypothetical protein
MSNKMVYIFARTSQNVGAVVEQLELNQGQWRRIWGAYQLKGLREPHVIFGYGAMEAPEFNEIMLEIKLRRGTFEHIKD